MKLILTGATGYVGAEVLRQSLQNPKVSSVVTLTRRPLSESDYTKAIDTSNSKLEAVIVKDFTAEYSPEVVQHLKDADGVIWNLGTVPGKGDLTEVQKTAVQMPNAVIQALSGAGRTTPVQFVYVSGFAVSRDQNANLWVKGDFRKIRGQAETIFIDAETQHPKAFKTYVFQMGGVTNSGIGSLLNPLPIMITLQQAAASMIQVALNGYDKQTLTNGEMKKLGQKVLSSKA